MAELQQAVAEKYLEFDNLDKSSQFAILAANTRNLEVQKRMTLAMDDNAQKMEMASRRNEESVDKLQAVTGGFGDRLEEASQTMNRAAHRMAEANGR